MTDNARTWAERLQRAAPNAQLIMLHTLAALLAGRADSDKLLTVADALIDASKEMLLRDRNQLAHTLQQLAAVLSDEAPRRA